MMLFWISLSLIAIVTIVIFILIYLYLTKEKDLTGQVVLVTGGANGLGKELCTRFACLRCKIAIADIDLANAENTVQEIHAKGFCKEARAYKIDVTKLEEIEQLKSNIEKDLGVVDIVVNNAVMLYTKPVEDEDPNILERIIRVNIMAIFWTTRVFIKAMKERKCGYIISIASAAALIGSPHMQAYGASKFAVRGFMESLAVDLKREGHGSYIHTTTVYPWFINTREYIQEFIDQVLKYCFVYEPQYVAKQIVTGVRRNRKIVTTPFFLYVFGYLINVTTFVNLLMKCFGKPPRKEMVFKDYP